MILFQVQPQGSHLHGSKALLGFLMFLEDHPELNVKCLVEKITRKPVSYHKKVF